MVEAIPKRIFQSLTGFPPNPIIAEDGWFADETGAFLAVVTLDNFDRDWGFAILAMDAHGQFRAIEFDTSLETRDDAIAQIYGRMVKLLTKGQRIFTQD